MLKEDHTFGKSVKSDNLITKSRISRFSIGLDTLIDALAVIAGVILCALTLLICLDAVGRTIVRFSNGAEWGYTIPWALDVAEYALYITTFFGAPWVLREGGHISIDLVLERLTPAFRHRFLVAADVIGALVCIILFYYSCDVWWTSFREQVLIHETFIFPEWTLLSIAPVSFFVMATIMLRRAHRPTVTLKRNKPDPGL